jgi:hypothetical protein
MRFLSDKFISWSGGSTCLDFITCWSQPSHFVSLNSPGKEVADFYEQLPVILRDLLYVSESVNFDAFLAIYISSDTRLLGLQRLNDDNPVVLKSTNAALSALTTCVPAEELVTHLPFIRNLIASMVSEARYRKGGVGDGQFYLPGFNMPKGERLVALYVCEYDDNFTRA